LATQKLTCQPIMSNFVYKVLQHYPKLDEYCSWNQQSRLKC